jgi:DNA-binding winged helix-turn-helix (wHTH) protein
LFYVLDLSSSYRFVVVGWSSVETKNLKPRTENAKSQTENRLETALKHFQRSQRGNVVYRFGGFTLNDSTRQLLSPSGELHLSPKAYELLTILLASRPNVVSKTELQERLWPETFVQETNIAGLVAEIRRNLRDPAGTPLFIRTVHRIGYRFVGDVTTDDAAPGATRSKFYLAMDDRRFFLMDGTNVIGRAPEAVVQIDSPGVSRLHARIRIEHGVATLEDLGSKNGTHLNGTRIDRARVLADGNEIRLGTIVLTFRSAPASDITETVGQ